MRRTIYFFDEYANLEKNVLETLHKDEEDYDGYENFLYLQDLKVRKDYRGFSIGKLLIKNLLIDHARDAPFAFLKAFPLQYQNYKRWSKEEEENANKINNIEFKSRNLKESQNKLINLYEECGFKLIEGNEEHMIIDLNSVDSYEKLIKL